MVRYSGFGLSIQRSWSRINGTSPLPVSQTSADMRPRIDQRVPGYVNGYVRRFWQVRRPLNYGSLCWEAWSCGTFLTLTKHG